MVCLQLLVLGWLLLGSYTSAAVDSVGSTAAKPALTARLVNHIAAVIRAAAPSATNSATSGSSTQISVSQISRMVTITTTRTITSQFTSVITSTRRATTITQSTSRNVVSFANATSTSSSKTTTSFSSTLLSSRSTTGSPSTSPGSRLATSLPSTSLSTSNLARGSTNTGNTKSSASVSTLATKRTTPSSTSYSWPYLIPTNVPIKGTTVDYGSTGDPNFKNVFRDGGGGVTFAGHNLMMFSDSYTTQNNSVNGQLDSFNSNTFAYGGISASNPRLLTDFGSNGYPMLEVALDPSTETYQGSNGRYAIWPSQSFIPLGTNSAIGFMPVLTDVSNTFNYMYTTLVQITIGSNGPVATRLVLSMFTYATIPYGSFGILAGPDGYNYLFAADTTGLKAARVVATISAMQDRTQYQYYNRGQWSSTMPTNTDVQSNIFNYTANYFGDIVGPYSGEMYFSAYHNTYVLVFMDGWVDGAFQVSYSTTGQLTGPWTAPTTLYSPAPASNQWNYAGHAYPGMDPSGRTLTLTYTYNNNFINIAKVTFCNGASSSCSDSSSTAQKRQLLSSTITHERFMANNGPCRIKFPSGCNVVVDEVEFDSNRVLSAHLHPSTVQDYDK